jgi:hypothetical protein
MGIFDKTQPVVGLFSDDADVQRVVERLQAKGYGLEDEEDFVIIDRSWVEAEISGGGRGMAVPAGDGSSGSVAVVPQPFDPGQTRWESTQEGVEAIKSAITDTGVDDEAAEFFAQRVARGATVIVVQADEEEVGEIQRLFEEVG